MPNPESIIIREELKALVNDIRAEKNKRAGHPYPSREAYEWCAERVEREIDKINKSLAG